MASELFKVTFSIKDSQGTIVTDKQQAIQTALKSIKRNRRELEIYSRSHPNFLYTLEPTPIPNQPLVAKLMAEATQKANVGPMAAVAGVIADLAVNDMVQDGCRVAVVEDGGEISAKSDRPVDVAFAAGEEPLSKRFGFRLVDFPVGVATSSGRFSHAFSFGEAEAATVFCSNACLADAAATAVGNVVKGENVESAIRAGIEKALSITGVEGVLVLYKGQVGTAGKIPQIIRVTQ